MLGGCGGEKWLAGDTKLHQEEVQLPRGGAGNDEDPQTICHGGETSKQNSKFFFSLNPFTPTVPPALRWLERTVP